MYTIRCTVYKPLKRARLFVGRQSSTGGGGLCWAQRVDCSVQIDACRITDHRVTDAHGVAGRVEARLSTTVADCLERLDDCCASQVLADQFAVHQRLRIDRRAVVVDHRLVAGCRGWLAARLVTMVGGLIGVSEENALPHCQLNLLNSIDVDELNKRRNSLLASSLCQISQLSIRKLCGFSGKFRGKFRRIRTGSVMDLIMTKLFVIMLITTRFVIEMLNSG